MSISLVRKRKVIIMTTGMDGGWMIGSIEVTDEVSYQVVVVEDFSRRNITAMR